MRHSKILQFVVMPAGLLVCSASVQQPDFPVLGGQPPGHPVETYVFEVDGFETTVFLDGLDNPWSLVFAPDGRMFISERPGTVRVGENGRLAAEPYGTIDVNAEGEGGLMGPAAARPESCRLEPGAAILSCRRWSPMGTATIHRGN